MGVGAQGDLRRQVAAGEPDDPLSFEVLDEPPDRGDPPPWIDDLFDGTPNIGRRCGAEIEDSQGNPELFEEGTDLPGLVVAAVRSVRSEDQEDAPSTVAPDGLQAGEGNGIGPSFDAELKIGEPRAFQFTGESASPDGLWIGEGEEPGVAPGTTGGDRADDTDENVGRQPVDAGIVIHFLEFLDQPTETVIGRGSANDDQLRFAPIDLSDPNRTSGGTEPVRHFRGRREILRVVDVDGDGGQVEVDLSDVTGAEDQLAVKDDVIRETEIGVEDVNGIGIGCRDIDPQLFVMRNH